MLDLRNMDCMDLMREYPDKYFDLAIVDPPYGIGYSDLVGIKQEKHGWKKRKSSQWDNQVPTQEYFNQLFRVSKHQIIWGGNYFPLPVTRCFIIWDKVQRIDQADCEFAWTSFDKSARIFQYARGNESGFAPKSIDTDKSFANMHPTQKPVALYKWLLTYYAMPLANQSVRCGHKHTKEYDHLCDVCKHPFKILDTHLGSGSIAIACHDYKFDLTACEIDKEYFDASMKRINNHMAQTTLF